MSLDIKTRAKELRFVKAGTLKADSRNWRRHPQEQADTLTEMMGRIGDAGVVLAREDENGDLVLYDGHLRAGLDADRTVAVVVTDLSEEEAGEALATFDPISAMAEFDEPALRSLITAIPGFEGLQALSAVGELYGLAGLAAGDGPQLGMGAAPQPGAAPQNTGGDNQQPQVSGVTKPVIIDVPEEKYSEFVQQLNELADLYHVDTWYAGLVRALATE